MSVKIRLRRMGKKKQPHYRIVVADSRSPRDGRFVENLGYYNPIPDPARLVVDLDRVDFWIGQGAILSRTVGNLVTKARAGGDDSVALGDRGTEAVAAENGKAAEADARPEPAADAGVPPEAEAASEPAATEADEGPAPEAEAASEAAATAEAEATPESAPEAEADAEPAPDAEADVAPEAEADAPAEATAEAEPSEGETA
ncbi:MAG: 30S ribosomal protein S16 [Gemmatimonadota bacterium]|nr:30S ribosomal protein S16 [Gemmatimonadota bacterium]